jgi:hypothetical protein
MMITAPKNRRMLTSLAIFYFLSRISFKSWIISR